MAELHYEDIKRAVQEILQRESLGILRDLRQRHDELRRHTQHLDQMKTQLQDVYARLQLIQQQANFENITRNSYMVLQAMQTLQQIVIDLQRRVVNLEQGSQTVQRMATEYHQRHQYMS